MNTFSDFVKNPSYNTLVDLIKVYLNREDHDTVSSIPFFIGVAEMNVQRLLRIREMEQITSITLDNDGFTDTKEGISYFKLPEGYLEMKHMWTDNSTLQRIPFEQMTVWEPDTSLEESVLFDTPWVQSEGVWAIIGDRVYIKGIKDDAEIHINFYQNIYKGLDETTDFTKFSDDVLYAIAFLSMGEGWYFLQEEQKASFWENKGMNILSQVQDQEDKHEYSGSTLQITPRFG